MIILIFLLLNSLVGGNKIDLEKERQVSTQEGMDLAKKLNCKFFELSAKTK
jgi:hypothetical protein